MKINMNQQPRICPICGQIYHEPPALFQEQMEKRKSAPTVAREKPFRALELAMKSRKKSSIPFISIQRTFECNIHNNPSEYLVHDRIPISVKVR